MKTLLFDVGGTWTRICVSDGRRLGRVIRTPTPKRWSQARQVFVRSAGELLNGHRPGGVIGGLPGTLSPDRRKLLAAPNLKGWVGQPIARDLKRIFQCPVTLENDAALNGLGEAVFGSGKGCSAVGFLTVSTGVNGVLCIDGQIDSGALPFELRKLLVSEGQRYVSLGSRISGRALTEQYGRPPVRIASRQIWRQTAGTLAMAVHNLLLAWRPDMMILGGSLIGTQAIRLSDVRAVLKKNWGLPFAQPPVVSGKLGDISGLYGALALLK